MNDRAARTDYFAARRELGKRVILKGITSICTGNEPLVRGFPEEGVGGLV